MRYASALAVTLLTTPCIAQELPSVHSLWRETQYFNWCFEITGISEPLPGSNDCVQVTGLLEQSLILSGYACMRDSRINLFKEVSADNSIGPDIFLGRYSSESMLLQHCTRMTNDWPPEYNCEHSIKFDQVASCTP